MFLINLDAALAVFAAAGLNLFVPTMKRWMILLGLSLALLGAAAPGALLVAVGQAALGFVSGLWLAGEKRKWKFWAAVSLQLIVLIAFKTFWENNPFLPLGLSFFTFQILSYLIDVYWGRQPAERNFLLFLTFAQLFITKIAGPIERSGLLQQLRSTPMPQSADLVRGGLMIWFGLFQKFVIADNLAAFVDPVFKGPGNFSGGVVTVAVLLSKYQIFADFSGISSIALGLGAIFGLRLTRNFNRPFAAATLRDFWRRWHISLQTWIRDYVFFPLLATRIARPGVLPPLIVSFVVFGLWHDFRWTFVVYGVLQALLVAWDPLRLLKVSLRPLAVPLNYVFFICLPSVLFRSQSLEQAGAIYRGLGFDMSDWGVFLSLGKSLSSALVFVVASEIWQWAESKNALYETIASQSWVARLFVSILLLSVLVAFSKFTPNTTFIYSNF